MSCCCRSCGRHEDVSEDYCRACYCRMRKGKVEERDVIVGYKRWKYSKGYISDLPWMDYACPTALPMPCGSSGSKPTAVTALPFLLQLFAL